MTARGGYQNNNAWSSPKVLAFVMELKETNTKSGLLNDVERLEGMVLGGIVAILITRTSVGVASYFKNRGGQKRCSKISECRLHTSVLSGMRILPIRVWDIPYAYTHTGCPYSSLELF